MRGKSDQVICPYFISTANFGYIKFPIHQDKQFPPCDYPHISFYLSYPFNMQTNSYFVNGTKKSQT